eukprot:gnl/Dysnectes_brevis/6440_a9994_239.p1 GENE.gnl/Dysnectes_brevis/6440_a9994_239~~gnl/Dysnectes_brevis/6440_a9994_239.p1  ORF type:complete len:418 (-),score=-9.93 gnl/Dysnectes_brevis/6440_a9994_239:46-1299(-)
MSTLPSIQHASPISISPDLTRIALICKDCNVRIFKIRINSITGSPQIKFINAITFPPTHFPIGLQFTQNKLYIVSKHVICVSTHQGCIVQQGLIPFVPNGICANNDTLAIYGTGVYIMTSTSAHHFFPLYRVSSAAWISTNQLALGIACGHLLICNTTNGRVLCSYGEKSGSSDLKNTITDINIVKNYELVYLTLGGKLAYLKYRPFTPPNMDLFGCGGLDNIPKTSDPTIFENPPNPSSGLQRITLPATRGPVLLPDLVRYTTFGNTEDLFVEMPSLFQRDDDDCCQSTSLTGNSLSLSVPDAIMSQGLMPPRIPIFDTSSILSPPLMDSPAPRLNRLYPRSVLVPGTDFLVVIDTCSLFLFSVKTFELLTSKPLPAVARGVVCCHETLVLVLDHGLCFWKVEIDPITSKISLMMQ